jgi:hypothetical protein
VRIAEDFLAPQRRDKLLGQGLTGEVDHFISKYRRDDTLFEIR